MNLFSTASGTPSVHLLYNFMPFFFLNNPLSPTSAVNVYTDVNHPSRSGQAVNNCSPQRKAHFSLPNGQLLGIPPHQGTGPRALHGSKLEFLIGLILCRSYAGKDRCCENTGATAMCFITMSSVINRHLAEMSLKTQGVIRGGGETFCTAGKLNSFRKSMKLTRFTCLFPSSNK